MHMMRWAATTALIGCMATPALADENRGFHMGVGWGGISTEIHDIEDIDIDFDEDEDALKVFGGWRFNRWLSVQLDYMDLGESQTDIDGGGRLDVTTHTWSPSIVGTLPIAFIELFASAGLLYYDVEADFSGNEVFDESDQGEIYGAGIGITVFERLALRLEYQQLEIDEFDSSDAYWLTGAWRF